VATGEVIAAGTEGHAGTRRKRWTCP